MHHNTRGILEMSAAMILSGTIGWMVVASQRPVVEVVFWRCFFGALCLLLICWRMAYLRRAMMSPRQWGLAIGVGLAIVLNWLLLFAAYAHTSISVATLVYNTQPFMLLALSAVLLRERIRTRHLAWLLLSFAGVLLIVQARPGGAYLYGILLALGAALCYAIAALLTKILQGVPPQLISLVQTLVGTVLLLPFAWRAAPMASASWPWLITLGVVHTGVMYILLYSAIQRLPTLLIATLSFLYPLVTLLIDVWVFALRPSPLQIAGGIAILCATAGMVATTKNKPT